MALIALDETPLTVDPCRDRTVARFGGLIALVFSSLALSTRHAALRRMGCDWDHVSYRPHVSIAVADYRDVRQVCAFAGALVFGPETIE